MRTPSFFLCLFLSVSLLAQNQIPQISEVGASFSFVDNRLTVSFDLTDAENDSVEIHFLLSDDEGNSYQLDVSQAMGDVGYPVIPGAGKAIYWDAPGNIYSPLLRVKIVADDRKDLDIQAIVDAVDSTRLREDLTFFGQPRHRNQHPQALQQMKDSIAERFTELGLAVRQQSWSYQGYDAANIIGRQAGYVDAEQFYIVDAHFDAVQGAPGADDNGSGVVGFLEAARVLSPYLGRKSVQYIGFDLEEAGLLGSIAYLSNAGGLSPAETLLGVLNFEMIGYYDSQPNSQTFPQGFNLLFPGAYNASAADSFRGNFLTNVANQNSNLLRQQLDSCAAAYVPALKVISIAVPGNGSIAPDLRRSDHAPFWEAAYPALMLTDGANFRNANYHTAGDSLETLNFTFMQRNVQAVVATIAKLADFRHASQAVASVQIQNVGIGSLQERCELQVMQERASLRLNLLPACPLEKARISLLDLSGRTIVRGVWENRPTSLQLSLPEIAKGLYLIQLESEAGSFTTKVLLVP